MKIDGYRNTYATLDLANRTQQSPLMRAADPQAQPRMYTPDDAPFAHVERTTQSPQHDIEGTGTRNTHRTVYDDQHADAVKNTDGTHVRDTWDDGTRHTRETWDDAGKHVRETWNADGKHSRDAWDESGKHLHDAWDVDGKHVRDTWDESGKHVRDTWDADGKHVRDTWDEEGNHIRETWDARGAYLRDAWNELERRLRNTLTANGNRVPDTTGDGGSRTPGCPGGAGNCAPGPTGGAGNYSPGPTGEGGAGAGGAGDNSADSAGDTDYDVSTDNGESTPDDTPPSGGPAGEPGFKGFGEQQRSILRNAYQHTKRMVDAALDKLHKTGGMDATFERWFGHPDGSNVKEVERVLTNMQHALANDRFTFVALPRTQDNWELAHVFPESRSHEIYLRPHFFDYGFGPKTPETTIAHELSHLLDIGGTKDYMYGPDNVHYLANRNSYTATHNAENYGMFIRDQNVA